MALAVLVGSIVVVGGIWVFIPHETQPCPTCGGTGARSCEATGCVNGRVRCTGNCLKRDDPNWSISVNPHFGPGTYTLRFQNDNGSFAEVSRLHVGQTMTLVNGVWALGGPCPLCNGTNMMTDPSCGGKLPCATCKGKGEIPK
jgi:hypothetical protein